MRRPVLVTAVVVLAAAATTAAVLATRDDDGDPSGPQPVTRDVTADDGAFAPKVIRLTRGSTLRFTNDDDVAHTFTAEGGVFHSGVVDPGDTYEVTVGGARTIAFHCEIHPGMTGTVEIR